MKLSAILFGMDQMLYAQLRPGATSVIFTARSWRVFRVKKILIFRNLKYIKVVNT